MQTLHGIHFLPIGRIDGTLLGLDSRFLGMRGLSLMALLTLATLVGQLGPNTPAPVWLRLCIGFSMVPAVLLTSLAHKLAHVFASRLAAAQWSWRRKAVLRYAAPPMSPRSIS